MCHRGVEESKSNNNNKNTNMSYDTRAFGDLGWQFVNAGELYRKLDAISEDDQLMMLGLFKQATIGDCQVDAAKKGAKENKHREAWIQFKGLENVEAMKKYIDCVGDLAKKYPTKQDHVNGDVKKENLATTVVASS